MSEYSCSHCNETFKKTRSEEDCWKEVDEIMPEAIHDEMAVLCDECWQEFMAWFRTLTAAEKKKMRADHAKGFS